MPSTQPFEPIVLSEHDEVTVSLTQDALHRLRRLVRHRLTILPADEPDQWVVRSSSHVGTVVTPDVRILIKPKVAATNLFYLLEAGGRTLRLDPAVFDYQHTLDLVPAFATFFAQHLEAALSKGTAREYRAHQERVMGVRGRVDLSAQLRLAGLAIPTECRFDEYNADTQLNRILLAGVTRLRRLPGVTVGTRQALQALAARLEEVGGLAPADLRSPTRFTRLNQHCQPAEQLARLVLASATLLDAAGESAAASFLVDMNQLFEDFVESRLRRYLSDHLEVVGQAQTVLDLAAKVRMKPDLVFRKNGLIVYVADAKYKVTANGYGREADYYQLLAYTSALALDEGLLVYCQHDGTAPPREVEVRHLGTRLRTHAVRLDGTPAHVEAQLRAVALDLIARVGAAGDRAVEQLQKLAHFSRPA